MNALLELEGVTLELGEREVLHDVSFRVQRGETKVILGASGSGKTTILRLMLGLTRPDRGAIRIAGHDIARLSERDLQRDCRQQMAMVFQNAALFDSLTVRENVGYRLWEQRNMPDDEIEKIVEDSLRFVGLDDVLDKMPGELSGGMRKRVGIAQSPGKWRTGDSLRRTDRRSRSDQYVRRHATHLRAQGKARYPDRRDTRH